jgi:hypothetical protein
MHQRVERNNQIVEVRGAGPSLSNQELVHLSYRCHIIIEREEVYLRHWQLQSCKLDPCTKFWSINPPTVTVTLAIS